MANGTLKNDFIKTIEVSKDITGAGLTKAGNVYYTDIDLPEKVQGRLIINIYPKVNYAEDDHLWIGNVLSTRIRVFSSDNSEYNKHYTIRIVYI